MTELEQIIVASVRATLIRELGWEESYAEPYLVPVMKDVLVAVAKAGYTWNPPKPKGGK